MRIALHSSISLRDILSFRHDLEAILAVENPEISEVLDMDGSETIGYIRSDRRRLL